MVKCSTQKEKEIGSGSERTRLKMRERECMCVHWGFCWGVGCNMTEITVGRTEENHISLTTTKHMHAYTRANLSVLLITCDGSGLETVEDYIAVM